MLSDGVVWLTPWRLDDAVALGDFDIDADLRRWFDLPDPSRDPAVRRAHGDEVIHRWWREWADGTSQTFALRLMEDGPAIGEADLQPRPEQAANIAYAVVPAHRGNGYAARAIRLLGEAGLTRFGYRRIELSCDLGNAASARAAVKAGFMYEGIRFGTAVYEEIEEWRGTPRDETIFSLIR
jgi:RimJ/RimL family protein N-acetyltransferase